MSCFWVVIIHIGLEMPFGITFFKVNLFIPLQRRHFNIILGVYLVILHNESDIDTKTCSISFADIFIFDVYSSKEPYFV